MQAILRTAREAMRDAAAFLQRSLADGASQNR